MHENAKPGSSCSTRPSETELAWLLILAGTRLACFSERDCQLVPAPPWILGSITDERWPTAHASPTETESSPCRGYIVLLACSLIRLTGLINMPTSLASLLLLSSLAGSTLAAPTVSLLIDNGYASTGTLSIKSVLSAVSTRKGSAFHFGSTYDTYAPNQVC